MPEIKFQTDDLISYREAVRILGISRMTLYAWVNKGKLNPLKIADRRYLFREEVERLLNEKSASND